MKTKTLICYLTIIENCLDKIVDEKSTEKEVNNNLYKYNVCSELIYVLLIHWRNINMNYDYNEVFSKVSVNMMHFLNEAEEHLRYTRMNYNYTNRKYWDIINRDLKK